LLLLVPEAFVQWRSCSPFEQQAGLARRITVNVVFPTGLTATLAAALDRMPTDEGFTFSAQVIRQCRCQGLGPVRSRLQR
jgi:hypothetical protein